NAARLGAQTGAMQGKSNSDITADVKTSMQNDGFDTTLFNPPTTGSITITVTDPSGNSVADALNAPVDSTISVKVGIPVTSTMWFGSYFLDPTLTQYETVVMKKQ